MCQQKLDANCVEQRHMEMARGNLYSALNSNGFIDDDDVGFSKVK